MEFRRILAIKFFVVDGCSPPACRIASGLGSNYASLSIKDLRECGYSLDDRKRDTLPEFIDRLKKRNIDIYLPEDFSDLDVDPLTYYLKKGHLTVNISQQEILIAYGSMVMGIYQKKIEKMLQVQDKRNIVSRLAIYKLGGFDSFKNRNTLTEKEFRERLLHLGLKWD